MGYFACLLLESTIVVQIYPESIMLRIKLTVLLSVALSLMVTVKSSALGSNPQKREASRNMDDATGLIRDVVKRGCKATNDKCTADNDCCKGYCVPVLDFGDSNDAVCAY